MRSVCTSYCATDSDGEEEVGDHNEEDPKIELVTAPPHEFTQTLTLAEQSALRALLATTQPPSPSVAGPVAKKNEGITTGTAALPTMGQANKIPEKRRTFVGEV